MIFAKAEELQPKDPMEADEEADEEAEKEMDDIRAKLREKLAKMESTLRGLEAIDDESVEALVHAKRAEVEATRERLASHRPIHLQMKVATEQLTKLLKKRSDADAEVQAMNVILAAKNQDIADYDEEVSKQRAVLDAIARRQDGARSPSHSVASQPRSAEELGFAFAATLPANVAASFKVWLGTIDAEEVRSTAYTPPEEEQERARQ